MKVFSFTLMAIFLIIIVPGCTFEGQKTALYTPAVPTQSVSNSTQSCYGRPTFSTLDEYEKYAASFTNQTDFITYDMIKELGNFRRFADISPSEHILLPDENGKRNGKCISYFYSLETESGQCFILFIFPNELVETTDSATFYELTGSLDLRKSEAANGWHTVDQILYNYDNGELKIIRWRTQTHCYEISLSKGSFMDYPAEGAPLSGMLNAETAASAAAEFNTNIAAARQQAEVKTG